MTVPMSRCLDVVVPLDEEYRQQNRTAAFTLWDDAIIAEHDADTYGYLVARSEPGKTELIVMFPVPETLQL